MIHICGNRLGKARSSHSADGDAAQQFSVANWRACVYNRAGSDIEGEKRVLRTILPDSYTLRRSSPRTARELLSTKVNKTQGLLWPRLLVTFPWVRLSLICFTGGNNAF
jgi:hypothetical protein